MSSICVASAQYLSSPVHTLCVGQASSMGSLLLTAGAPGSRVALPNARIMIHQPSGGTQVRFNAAARCGPALGAPG